MSKIAPIATIIFSIIVLAFLAGTMTAHYRIFPYPNIRDAVRTLQALTGELDDEDASASEIDRRIEATTIPASTAQSARWTILETSAPRFPVIAFGDRNQFLDHCPDNGCLAAVVFDAEGEETTRINGAMAHFVPLTTR